MMGGLLWLALGWAPIDDGGYYVCLLQPNVAAVFFLGGWRLDGPYCGQREPDPCAFAGKNNLENGCDLVIVCIFVGCLMLIELGSAEIYSADHYGPLKHGQVVFSNTTSTLFGV